MDFPQEKPGKLGYLETKKGQSEVSEVIEKSFDKRPMPSGNITQREVDRRVALAKNIYQVLLWELKWSHERIIDHLLWLLVKAIDGEELPSFDVESDESSAMWGSPDNLVERENRLSAIRGNGERLVLLPHEIRRGRN